ncbi:MAG: ABC transporter ATP-binding protein [Chloroflexi bacterium]|nr:ABC transporter ATP-binding protein [Chloroflexota bacterium]
MNDPVIRVERLGKSYRIGQLQSHRTLQESLSNAAKLPVRALRSLVRKEAGRPSKNPTIWALKDVSFEIRKGEVVGIIGRNGAGKSTLLKILSKITLPTEGRIERRGRVGSLLEIGTGFHPELTGRENIYLNGAMLGMKKTEIARKFDEIVAFAEINRFLDTPVKHYSSGMYVRLAFAVAAHLEPEILIVDEVLAVGDTAFQRKCLGKMNEVAKGGRTVLFVSHNIGVIQTLCSRAILLQNGTVLADGDAAETVGAYLRRLEGFASQDLSTRPDRGGKGLIRITRVEISMGGNSPASILATGRPARFAFSVDRARPGMSCSFTVYDQFGQPVTFFDSAVHGRGDVSGLPDTSAFVCEVDELTLMPGRYRINAAVMWNGEYQDHLEAAAYFSVEQGEFGGRPAPQEGGYGNLLIHHRWITPGSKEALQ